jgi:hypothetical protein
MPSFCGVIGCANNAMRNYDKSYHKIPSERDERGRIQKQRSERRQAWIQALHRKDLTDVKLKYLKICSDHFISGKPASPGDVTHPDYIPTQNMDYKHEAKKGAMGRFRKQRLEEENGEEDLSQDNTDDAMWIENVREATAGQRVSPVTPQGHPPNKKRLQETQEQSFTDEVPRTVKEEFNTPRVAEDRFDVFGKLVAMKLRSLPKEEMLLAEKYISDTLFHAEMGDLNGVDNVSVQYDSN